MFFITRFIKNRIGSIKGFGSCPNCDDCWSWKKQNTVMYSDFSGVLICEECLSKPQLLDIKRIEKKLSYYGWDRLNIALVRTALYKLKEGKE